MTDRNTEERFERLDNDVRVLGERMVGVEAGVNSLGRTFDQFYATFEQTTSLQRNAQKTQWPVIFGVLALVLTIIGGFMSGYLRDLNRVENSVSAIKERRQSDVDPVQTSQIIDLAAKLEPLRESNNRVSERSARNEALAEEMRGVKNEFITHIRDGHPERVDAKIEVLKDEVERRFKESYEQEDFYRESNEERLARMRERIDLLENRWAVEHTTGHGSHHE